MNHHSLSPASDHAMDRPRLPQSHVIRFGDGADLSAELLRLIRSGQKTAASGSWDHFRHSETDMPHAGDFIVGVDDRNSPSVLLRVEQADLVPFHRVSEDFIHAEGEGSPEEWREANEAYLRRKGPFSPEMMLLCLRFHLICPLLDERGQHG